jgi:exopolyphosphatase/pppGpp-phosphohydrolase
MTNYVLDVGSHSLKMYQLDDTSANLVGTLTWHLLEESDPYHAMSSGVKSILKKCLPDAVVIAIGTEALRRKPELKSIALDVFKLHGIDLHVITQVEEAVLIRRAFLKMHKHFDVDVVNVGGGSIQIVQRNNRMTLLDFGICDLNTRFRLGQSPDGRMVDECIDWISSHLPLDLQDFAYTGGELTYLNRLNVSTVHSWCTRSSFETLAQRLALLDEAELELLSPYDPKWMRGAIASNCIVLSLLRKASVERFYASDLNITNGFLASFGAESC